MNIPYTYLAVLLVFTLLIGVVIGDRLAAGSEGEGPGRSGSCAGLASARLHACVHRYGRLRAAKRTPRSGESAWEDRHTDASCELAEDRREEQ